jgi:hypothetical protein
LPGSGSRADQCAQQGGHSRLAVTLEIYTHDDRQAQREALHMITASDADSGASPTLSLASAKVRSNQPLSIGSAGWCAVSDLTTTSTAMTWS